jgi:MFS family permease
MNVATKPSAVFWVAAGLALGAAVSLGLARFSYALLLPPMRADLGWSYFTAGAMNTANAAGYLLGALMTPKLLRRWGARRMLMLGCVATTALLAAHGGVLNDASLLVLRLLTGISSALVFVSGGLMAARLGAGQANAGLVLGIYYGGTGLGIISSTLLVPPLAARTVPHAWQGAWWALAAAALMATLATAGATRQQVEPPPPTVGHAQGFKWQAFAFGLAGYFMFGLGYIGYMTFTITLLREQGLETSLVNAYFCVLGAAERFVGHGHGDAGVEHAACRGVRIGRAVWLCVSVGSRVHHSFGSTQLANQRMVGRHRGIHRGVCGRPNRRAECGGLVGRWQWWLANRARVFGGDVGLGIAVGLVAKTTGASLKLRQVSFKNRRMRSRSSAKPRLKSASRGALPAT